MYSDINFPSLTSTKLGFRICHSEDILQIETDAIKGSSKFLERMITPAPDMIGKIIPYKIKTVEYSSCLDFSITLKDSDGNTLVGKVSHLYVHQWTQFVNLLNKMVYPFLLKEMIINITNGSVTKLGNILIGKDGIFFEKIFSSKQVCISWDMIDYKIEYGQLRIRHLARAYKSIESSTITIKNSIIVPLLIEFMREAKKRSIAPEFLLYECYPVLLRL